VKKKSAAKSHQRDVKAVKTKTWVQDLFNM
jgi:hypothetical protein